jgi:hypothetical protein
MNAESFDNVPAVYRDALARFETAMLALTFAVAEKDIEARSAHRASSSQGMAQLIALNSLFAQKGFALESLCGA